MSIKKRNSMPKKKQVNDLCGTMKETIKVRAIARNQ